MKLTYSFFKVAFRRIFFKKEPFNIFRIIKTALNQLDMSYDH